MSRPLTVVVLFVAALLESRSRFHAPGLTARMCGLAQGRRVFGYGAAVNTPPWDLVPLLGLDVVFVFVIAQATAWLFLQQPPTQSVLLAAAFIIVSGTIVR